MFNLNDQAIDKIFAQNLGVTEGINTAAAQAPAPAAPAAPAVPPPVPQMAPPVPQMPQQPAGNYGGYQAPPPVPVPTPQAPVAQPQQQAGPKGLFNVDDAAMDRIFNDLTVNDQKAANPQQQQQPQQQPQQQQQPAQAPKLNVREAVSQIRTLAEMPKMEGVGRLSLEEPGEQAAPGKINQIGKFLLDQQDLQKLSNIAQSDLSDGKVRVLTHEASEEISKLLEHIATQPGVVGSVIVGHDGILIANSLPKELDPETIGILSLGIYVNTTNIAKKMGHNHLHQLVSRTPHGYLVIADFGGGILVTVSNGQETEKLIPLMRSITQLVAQN